MSEAGPSALERLAARAGILPGYVDQTGNERSTTDETRRAILAAMGLDASTDSAARETLAALDERDRREVLPPVVVGRLGAQTREAGPRGVEGRWRLEIRSEDGEPRVIDGEGATTSIPDLPVGYHQLRFTGRIGGHETQVEQLRVVTPPRCVSPDDLLDGRSAFGLIANLYTLRSSTNWGIGDLHDLGSLAEWGGSVGAEFVGVNPLHTLLNRGNDVSPYSPVSRIFRNPIYIDPARLPELDDAPEIRERLASPEFIAQLESLRESPAVRYEQVMAVKGIVLDALHGVFDRNRQQGVDRRAAEYQAYVDRAGSSLTSFATWMAIAERHGANWREWPETLRDPSSSAVDNFAREHSARVDFHRWMQWVADEQLAKAASRAKDAGMRIGLYQDLAIGSSPSGADTWANPGLFARGVAVGAPPDPYAANGQNWGFPPIDPRALRASGYRYFIDLLRGAFRHGGALRIDHVLGFFRLFWIPDGMSGDQGAYVRYPADDLFGILALESVRHRALVVGEDLGTVPPEVPPMLESWGVLSSKVMFFERDGDGSFRSPDRYPELALATADTHDMSPIAGFWSGVDIDIRERVGLIDAAAAEDDRRRREDDRRALLDRLAAEQVLPEPAAPAPSALCGAVHAMMCRTPAKLVGLSLDDLAGESEPVNVPGVGPDRFESWTRKMREPLETIAISPETDAALRCDGRRGRRDG